MKIGIFTDTYTPFVNGVTTSILMLRKILEQKGHIVYIVTVSQDKKFHIEEDGKVIRLPSIPVNIYDYRISNIYSKKAMKIIKKWDLDIIHSQTEFGIGMFSKIVARKLKIPAVHTYHTLYEEYMHYINKGHFKKISKKIAKRFTLMFCNRKKLKLIVPTSKIYKLFKDKYKVKKEVYIVPTGIDTEKFKLENYTEFDKSKLRKELKINEDDFVILFVGRIGKEKNVDFLVNSMNNFSNPKIKLLVVGEGPELEKLKQESNENIIFTGKVKWEEIQKYYFISDCFATASRSETQGLTVIEAMAAGLPIIAIDDESFKDTVIEDENGLYFNDENEYQEKILKLFNNKEIKNNLSKGAKITSDKYSIETFGNSILKIYNEAGKV